METFYGAGSRARGRGHYVQLSSTQLRLPAAALDLGALENAPYVLLRGDKEARQIEVVPCGSNDMGALRLSHSQGTGRTRTISVTGFARWFDLSQTECGARTCTSLGDRPGLRIDLADAASMG